MADKTYTSSTKTYSLKENFIGVYTIPFENDREVAVDYLDDETLSEDITTLETEGTIIGSKMIGYYPQVVKQIKDIEAVCYAVGIELDNARAKMVENTNDGFLYWMSEDRVQEWEKALELSYAETDSLDARRAAIVAKLRGQNKLDESSIQKIINAFTGGTATVTFDGTTLEVDIEPPDDGTEFNRDTVEKELRNRLPAHLLLKVYRNYSTWGDVMSRHTDWQDVADSYSSWKELHDYIDPNKE